jgi:rhodanese-related sulfurtransferase
LTGLDAAVPELDPVTASERLAGGAVVLDVREEDEWEAGRIAGSVHIPLGALGPRQGEIPQAPLIVVCRSGSRSAYAAAALIRAGYSAENLTGGLEAWRAAGLPLEPSGGFVA